MRRRWFSDYCIQSPDSYYRLRVGNLDSQGCCGERLDNICWCGMEAPGLILSVAGREGGREGGGREGGREGGRGGKEGRGEIIFIVVSHTFSFAVLSLHLTSTAHLLFIPAATFVSTSILIHTDPTWWRG